MTTQTASFTSDSERTITHIWKRFNARWILTGVVSGMLAGLFALGAAMLIAAVTMGEWSQPLKLLGATFFGPEATRFGPVGKAGFFGLVLHLALSAFFGGVFAQLVDERSRGRSLIAMGFVTSSIIWVFGCSLFLPSFNIILAEALPRFMGLFLHWTFGLSFAVFLILTRPFFLRQTGSPQ